MNNIQQRQDVLYDTMFSDSLYYALCEPLFLNLTYTDTNFQMSHVLKSRLKKEKEKKQRTADMVVLKILEKRFRSKNSSLQDFNPRLNIARVASEASPPMAPIVAFKHV